MEFNNLISAYITVGAGGVSFVALIIILYQQLKHVTPGLNKIHEDNKIMRTIIENNTKAIDEVSKSNTNVAEALKLLQNSFKSVSNGQESIINKTDVISIEVAKIRETTRNCAKKE